jgi:hypothetical protein
MEISNPELDVPLVVRDSDLDPKAADALRAAQNGDQILGPFDFVLADSVPRAILNRVLKVVPQDSFVIADITMKFTLGGELLGVKVGGDVSVKLTPKK